MERSYSLEQFKKAVEESCSKAETLRKLGLAPTGGNYTCFNQLVEEQNIDTSHFTGRGHLIGKTHDYRLRPLEEILISGKYFNTHSLRLRLIKERIKEHRCECCELESWLDEPIPLELDHIDGDNRNNLLENLRILCPNCHAKTPTYRGKNKKSQKKIHQENKKFKCTSCGVSLKGNAKTGMCKPCYSLTQRKVKRPPIEQLLEELSNSSFLAVGKKYGVSDNAIRKWIKYKE